MDLYKIVIKHSFFKEDKCVVLNFKPTHSTIRILSNYGLEYRVIGNEFLIIPTQKDGLQFDNVTKEEVLRFNIETTDVYFKNYTQIDLHKQHSDILYYANIPDHEGEDYLGKFDELRNSVEMVKDFVKLKKDSSGLPNKISVLNGYGDVEFIGLDKLIEINDELVLDISELSPGYYSIKVGEKQALKVYKNFESPMVSQLGILELSLKNLTTKEVEIEFESRKTNWRYFLGGTSFKDLKKPTFVKKEESFAFKKITDETQLSKQFYWILELEEPLAFKQVIPIEEYGRLVESDGVQDIELIKNLPIPNPDNIILSDDGVSFYSDIFIY